MSLFSIKGAGVGGLAVATELVLRGAQVQIFDPAGLPGPHCCSWWAGGMLAPWCEYENADEAVLRLGKRAAGWWSSHTAVTCRGTLVVASRRDWPDLRNFAKRTHGHRAVDGEIGALEPELAGFARGLFFPREAHLNPRQALADLVSRLRDKGVRIHPTVAPEGLGNVIDCTGMAARTALPALRGVRGEMLIIRCPDLALSRPIRLLHPRIPLYIVPRGEGIYMLGATMIESQDRKRISARSLLELLSAAYALNPAFGEAEVLETGVDLRPAFPNNLPRISRRGATVFANGLYRHGYLLVPAMAQAVADLVLNNIHSEMVDENIAER